MHALYRTYKGATTAEHLCGPEFKTLWESCGLVVKAYLIKLRIKDATQRAEKL